jgi:hypothetical protein
MADPSETRLRTLMRALSRLRRALPKDLRNQPLAELEKRWQDPADRARLEAALAPVAQAAGPVVQEVHEFFQEFQELLRQFGQGLGQLQQFLQRTQRQIAAVAGSVQRVPHLASHYCQPYQRRIADWHLPPLSPAEEWQFLASSALLTSRNERARGLRPPLEQIALIHNRLDVAVAVLYEAHPELYTSARRKSRLPDEWEEVPGDVVMVLQEEVLPSIRRRLLPLTPAQARSELEELLSQQYLVAAVCRDIGRRRQAARLAAPPEEELPEDPADAAVEVRQSEELDAVAVESVLAAYLAQSDRPDLDAQIVAAMGAGRPMARLAAEVGVPARTLTHRRRKLLRYCRRELGVD